MSWLARSVASSLRLDADEDEENDHEHRTATSKPQTPSFSKRDEDHQNEESHHHEDPSRGVKEDLSELKQTLTRQLWGVASFLAPPPSQPSTPSLSQTVRSVSDWNRWEPAERSVSVDVSEEEASDSAGISGIRGEISGFRSRAVSGISKIASNFLSFGSEEGNEALLEEYEVVNAVGITEEVLAFARNIAMHPETWLDFPQDEEEDIDDFEMSDTQQEHAFAVEHLAPRLAALRIELCPSHMSEGYFWKVYFVLLHSRLTKQDAELLSTPQVLTARALWMQELQKQAKQKQYWPGRYSSYSNESRSLQQEDLAPAPFYNAHSLNMPLRTSAFEPPGTHPGATDFVTEKHPVVSSEMKIIDKSVIEEKLVMKTKDTEISAGPSPKVLLQTYEDYGDDWPEEESFELGGFSGTTIHVGNEEDVSFSDLEDDNDSYLPVKSKSIKGIDSSTKTP